MLIKLIATGVVLTLIFSVLLVLSDDVKSLEKWGDLLATAFSLTSIGTALLTFTGVFYMIWF